MTRQLLLGGLGVTSLLAGLALWIVLPGTWPFSLGLVVAGLALTALTQIPSVREGVERPKLRMSPAAARAAVIVLALVAINLAMSLLPLRVELAQPGRSDLSEATRSLLDELDAPVEIELIFPRGTASGVAAPTRAIASEYARLSPQISLRETDPIANPEAARRHGLDETGVAGGAVVVRGAMGSAVLLVPDLAVNAEAALTNAIANADGQLQYTIYFAAGPGLRGPGAGYDAAADQLSAAGFAVESIDLAAGDALPADAAALLLVGSRFNLGAAEAEAINAYLEDGGRVLLALDPLADPTLEAFLASYDIELREGEIVDPASNAAPLPTDILVPGIRNAFELGPVHFPGVAPLRPSLAMPETVAVSALGVTSREAFVSSGGGERTAPATLPVGLLVSFGQAGEAGERREGRLAIIGDSDFAADAHIADGANGAFLVAVVDWLTDGADRIEIPLSAQGAGRLVVTPAQVRFIGLSSIVLLPLLVLGIGLAVRVRS